MQTTYVSNLHYEIGILKIHRLIQSREFKDIGTFHEVYTLKNI